MKIWQIVVCVCECVCVCVCVCVCLRKRAYLSAVLFDLHKAFTVKYHEEH